MKKFKDFEYIRPDIEGYKKNVKEQLEVFNKAGTVEEQIEIMTALNKLENDVSTMSELCFIRNSIDTKDEFYDKELEFMDEMLPEVEGVKTEYYKTIIASKFKNQLIEKFGDLLF